MVCRTRPRGRSPGRVVGVAAARAAAASRSRSPASSSLLSFVPGILWSRCGARRLPQRPPADRVSARRRAAAARSRGQGVRDPGPRRGAGGAARRGAASPCSEAFIAVEDQRFLAAPRRGLAAGVGRALGQPPVARLRAGVQHDHHAARAQRLRRAHPRPRADACRGSCWRCGRRAPSRTSSRKPQILELYLNHVYFGNGAKGIEAAARHYFGTTTRALTLPQGALLAALLKGPALFDPRRHPERARERRDLVLTLMEQQGRIPAAEAAAARKAPLGVLSRSRAGRSDDGPAPHFVEQVRRELEERFGEELYDEPLRIHTTLDVGAQKAAEEELIRQLKTVEGGSAGRLRGPKYAVHPADDAALRVPARRGGRPRRGAPATCWPGWAAATSCIRASTAWWPRGGRPGARSSPSCSRPRWARGGC